MLRAAGLCLVAAATLAQVATERAPGLTVDFIAVQADGTPAADLRAADVEIKIGDRVRTIKALHRVAGAPAPASATPASRIVPPYGTNANVSAGRRFVLIVDQESIRTGHEQLIRNAVEGFAAHLAPLDATMVAALPFGGVRLPFTPDAARVRRAIDGVAGQGSPTETGSDLACRTRRFLESLEGFLAERAAATQPSTVVVFTAGLAAPRRDAAMAMAPGMCELVTEQFRRLSSAISAARFNVYVVVPADIRMNASAYRETISGADFRGSDNPLEGIEHFEGATGAVRVPLDATGTSSLMRVLKESASYYRAELEPIRGEVLGRSRAFSVKSLRRDVVVRARPEITLRDPAKQSATATRLTVPDLLGSLEPVTDLALRVAGFPVKDATGAIRVGVLIETEDPVATIASAGALLIAPDGRVAGRWFAKDAAERPLLGAIAVPAGEYTLRVAALDSAGRAGVAEDTVDVALTSVGPLSLGSLMLGVSRPEGMKLQLEFATEPTAIASFDIYGGSPATKLGAALEIARAADGPALATLPVTLARADETRVTATAAVPLGALAPGDYVIRALVRLEDGTIGKITRTLRKVAK